MAENVAVFVLVVLFYRLLLCALITFLILLGREAPAECLSVMQPLPI